MWRFIVSDQQRFRFVDIFAGIGAFRLAFEQAGGECVFTSEWDEYALKTYKANFNTANHALVGDITKVDAESIPDHDVLLAGFPCQPFSIAGVSTKQFLGREHGFEDETQGTLFFDVARIIAAKRPDAFVLENVKNLMSHDKGRTFEVISKTLRDKLGYDLHCRVIDAQNFVPQMRQRIFMVGYKTPRRFNWGALPLRPVAPPTLGSLLHQEGAAAPPVDEGRYTDELGNAHPRYILSDKLWAWLQGHAAKHQGKGNGFGFGLVGPQSVARTISARYYKDGSEVLVDRGEANPRKLTPRECARLMGFPDDFKIVTSDSRAYKQFGNSIVVPVIKHVAALMLPHLEPA